MTVRGISSRTAELWKGVGKQKPLQLELCALCLALITIFVTIIINATVASDEYNDEYHYYASDTSWMVMMPTPGISLLWAILNINILISSRLAFHPGYAITKAIVDIASNMATGMFTIMLYYWNAIWVPCVFMFITVAFDLVYIGYAAHTIRLTKRHERVKRKAPVLCDSCMNKV